jgi:hypothetical protein
MAFSFIITPFQKDQKHGLCHSVIAGMDPSNALREKTLWK